MNFIVKNKVFVISGIILVILLIVSIKIREYIRISQEKKRIREEKATFLKEIIALEENINNLNDFHKEKTQSIEHEILDIEKKIKGYLKDKFFIEKVKESFFKVEEKLEELILWEELKSQNDIHEIVLNSLSKNNYRQIISEIKDLEDKLVLENEKNSFLGKFFSKKSKISNFLDEKRNQKLVLENNLIQGEDYNNLFLEKMQEITENINNVKEEIKMEFLTVINDFKESLKEY